MKVTTENNDGCLTAYVEGRVDTNTAPKLENELRSVVDDIDSLVLDLDKVEYISSAGLRVILSMQKQLQKKGGMVVRHISDAVMEIFEVTGFTEILTIEA